LSSSDSINFHQTANGVTALELSESIASRLSAIELKEKLYRIITKTLPLLNRIRIQ